MNAEQSLSFSNRSRAARRGIVAAALLVVLGGCQREQTIPTRSELGDSWNVVIIVIDTLRADHMGAYGYELRSTTPVFDELAARSVLFDAAYSPSSWTRTAIASLISSRHPFEHRLMNESPTDRLGKNTLTLAEFLKERGYGTKLFYTNPHYWFGLIQGFDRSDYEWNDTADNVVDRAEHWLGETARDKFFLMVHFMDPHDIYRYHPEFPFAAESFGLRVVSQLYENVGREGGVGSSCANRKAHKNLAPDDLRDFEAAYDGEVAFTDRHLGRLLEALAAQGHAEDTLIVITSDHGEEFLDHDGFWHGCTLYEELIRAPLLIHLPGLPPRRLPQRVSLVDIFPTIVDLVDATSLPGLDLSGQSLLPLLLEEPWEERSVVSATAFRGAPQFAITSGRHKLILHSEDDRRELYDLVEDPEERRELLSTGKGPDRARAEALEAELRALGWTESGPEGGNDPGPRSTLDDEERRQLEGLGYIAE